jgi:hypothetical protein
VIVIEKSINVSTLLSYFGELMSGKCYFLWVFSICLSCSQPVCVAPNEDVNIKVISEITLQPGADGKDAGVSTYYPEDNFGSVKNLNALTWTENVLPYTERGYIDFDVKKYLPDNVKIQRAYLRLFADTINKNPGIKGHSIQSYQGIKLNNDWQIYRIVSQWNEDKITWFDQPEVSMIDVINLPGPQFSSQSVTVDVTEHIRQKYKGNPGYNGFMIRNKVESPYQCVVFCSSDNDQKEMRPQLVVEYEK